MKLSILVIDATYLNRTVKCREGGIASDFCPRRSFRQYIAMSLPFVPYKSRVLIHHALDEQQIPILPFFASLDDRIRFSCAFVEVKPFNQT